MKNKYKYILIMVIILTVAILSDWDNFKAGLMGNPPVEVENTDIN